MTELGALKQLLGAMGRSAVPVDEPETADKQRDVVVSHVVHTIAVKANERRRSERRRRLLNRLLFAAILPATIIGAAAGSKFLLSEGRRPEAAAALGTHGRLELKRQSVTRSVSPGQTESIASGDEVATENGGTARLTLPGGAALVVASATRLQLSDLSVQSQVVDVKRGFVTVTVPKLHDDGAFTVATPDARIVVHGTMFTVEVESPSPLVHWTTVTVSEGVVSIFHSGSELRLASGGRWTSRRSGDGSAARSGAPALVPVTPRAAAHPSLVSPAPSSRAPNDDLSAQNELFTQALRARKAGDDRSALRWLSELLRRYPHAAMEHEALVEQLRALHRLGASEGTEAARRYLARYPEGYAAAEARAILQPE